MGTPETKEKTTTTNPRRNLLKKLNVASTFGTYKVLEGSSTDNETASFKNNNKKEKRKTKLVNLLVKEAAYAAKPAKYQSQFIKKNN